MAPNPFPTANIPPPIQQRLTQIAQAADVVKVQQDLTTRYQRQQQLLMQQQQAHFLQQKNKQQKIPPLPVPASLPQQRPNNNAGTNVTTSAADVDQANTDVNSPDQRLLDLLEAIPPSARTSQIAQLASSLANSLKKTNGGIPAAHRGGLKPPVPPPVPPPVGFDGGIQQQKPPAIAGMAQTNKLPFPGHAVPNTNPVVHQHHGLHHHHQQQNQHMNLTLSQQQLLQQLHRQQQHQQHLQQQQSLQHHYQQLLQLASNKSTASQGAGIMNDLQSRMLEGIMAQQGHAQQQHQQRLAAAAAAQRQILGQKRGRSSADVEVDAAAFRMRQRQLREELDRRQKQEMNNNKDDDVIVIDGDTDEEKDEDDNAIVDLSHQAREQQALQYHRYLEEQRRMQQQQEEEQLQLQLQLRLQQQIEDEYNDYGDDGDDGSGTFIEYKPRKLPYGAPHPDPVVETASLAAVPPPNITYELAAYKELVDAGSLSALQLEAVVYACQRHETRLPDGSKAGFFLGDGAGVGKGRTIAGLILENWKRGRKKHIWVSVGADLKIDARRDLDDVGATDLPLHALNKLPYGKMSSVNFIKKAKVDVTEGVMFLTYNALTSSADNGRSRIKQLIEWCGPDFDGLIVFDEAHKAKNLVAEGSGSGKATQVGLRVKELQSSLPGARLMYCSATGASEPRHLAYMSRLGLWGQGNTGFPDFLKFMEAIQGKSSAMSRSRSVSAGGGMADQGSAPALELVAMDMKAQGMFLCRTLSFAGAEFAVVEAPLDQDMATQYTIAAAMWNLVYREFMGAEEDIAAIIGSGDGGREDFNNGEPSGSAPPTTAKSGGNNTGTDNNGSFVHTYSSSYTALSKNRWRTFWGSHQRFFMHMCMAAKVPSVIAMAKDAVARNKAVVIGLQTTGEARTADVVAEKGFELEDFVSGPKELIMRLVEDYYPLPPDPDVDSDEDEDDLDFGTGAVLPNHGRDLSVRQAKARSIRYKEYGESEIDDDSSSDEDEEDDSEEDEEEDEEEGEEEEGEERGKGEEEEKSEVYAPSDSKEEDGDEDASLVGSDEDENSSESSERTLSAGDDEDGGDKKKVKDPAANGNENGNAPLSDKKKSLAEVNSTTDIKKLSLAEAKSKERKEELARRKAKAAERREQERVQAQLLEEWKEKARGALAVAKAKKAELKEKVAQLELPSNPLDMLIDGLGGPDCVAEMTGRKARLVRNTTATAARKDGTGGTTGGGVIFQARNASGVGEGASLEMINVHERELFMAGKKLIAIISEAASAGISLHADRRVVNQRRRVHLTLELPWSADKAIQQFGRSHRANQAHGPQYRLMFTPLGGERRFAASIAKRLESLGALTQGDRRAGPSLAAYNYESNWGQMALREMYATVLEEMPPLATPVECLPGPVVGGVAAPPMLSLLQFCGKIRAELLNCGLLKKRVEEVSFYDIHKYLESEQGAPRGSVSLEEKERGDVPRFLNRLLGLTPAAQHSIFDFYQLTLEAVMDKARREGTLDDGVVDIQAHRIVLKEEPKLLATDPISGAGTWLYVIETDKGLPWDAAVEKLKQHRNILELESAAEAFMSRMFNDDVDADVGTGDVGKDKYEDKKEGEIAAATIAGKDDGDKKTWQSGFYKARGRASLIEDKNKEKKNDDDEEPLSKQNAILLALFVDKSDPPAFQIYKPASGRNRQIMPLKQLKKKYIPVILEEEEEGVGKEEEKKEGEAMEEDGKDVEDKEEEDEEEGDEQNDKNKDMEEGTNTKSGGGQAMWEEIYKLADKSFSGPKELITDDGVPPRRRTIYLLTGAVIRCWATVHRALVKHVTRRKDRKMKVVRIATTATVHHNDDADDKKKEGKEGEGKMVIKKEKEEEGGEDKIDMENSLKLVGVLIPEAAVDDVVTGLTSKA